MAGNPSAQNRCAKTISSRIVRIRGKTSSLVWNWHGFLSFNQKVLCPHAPKKIIRWWHQLAGVGGQSKADSLVKLFGGIQWMTMVAPGLGGWCLVADNWRAVDSEDDVPRQPKEWNENKSVWPGGIHPAVIMLLASIITGPKWKLVQAIIHRGEILGRQCTGCRFMDRRPGQRHRKLQVTQHRKQGHGDGNSGANGTIRSRGSSDLPESAKMRMFSERCTRLTWPKIGKDMETFVRVFRLFCRCNCHRPGRRQFIQNVRQNRTFDLI